MRVSRLARRPFARLDGEGARRFGGRWNSPGVPVVYASVTLSLAVLEYLARTESDLLPDDLVRLEILVPDELTRTTFDVGDAGPAWRTTVGRTRAVGDDWATALATPLLLVPSVLVPEEWNVLINPAHPASAGIRTTRTMPFRLDERLVGRRRRL